MQKRWLVVVADDYGIGPETSRGILELMRTGVVTGTVLLVNSLYAASDIRRWKQSGRAGEIGWHPNLSLDRPTAPAEQVSSLITDSGHFISLGTLLLRLATGQVRYAEVVREFDAQFRLFCDFVGHPPTLLNGHKHIHVFPLISRALTEVLQRWKVRPYVRRVVDPWSCLRAVPGARLKRLFLSAFGRRAAKRQDRAGFTGNDVLAGITDPKWVKDPQFFARWLARVPGQVVELAVHPGHLDATLLGRDCSATDGQQQRRVDEQRLLSHPDFRAACAQAGFTLCPASRIGSLMTEELQDAA